MRVSTVRQDATHGIAVLAGLDDAVAALLGADDAALTWHGEAGRVETTANRAADLRASERQAVERTLPTEHGEKAATDLVETGLIT